MKNGRNVSRDKSRDKLADVRSRNYVGQPSAKRYYGLVEVTEGGKASKPRTFMTETTDDRSQAEGDVKTLARTLGQTFKTVTTLGVYRLAN